MLTMTIDRTMRALGDPTRREILRALRAGDLTAGELGARFPITAASVSHHLNVLKEAELVQAERDGRTIVYSLNSTVLQDFVGELLRFFEVGASGVGGVTAGGTDQGTDTDDRGAAGEGGDDE
jgi:DNA-binding transcriptional ArsR family regulator